MPDEAKETWADKFGWGLEQLIAEMRKTGSGGVTLSVRNGKPITIEGNQKAYQFAFEGEAEDLFEGASVMITAGAVRSPGRIFSILATEKIILITSDRELGDFIANAILRVDNTAMLEQLAKRLSETKTATEGSFSAPLANATLENHSIPLSGNRIAPSTQVRLNPDQHAAAQGALDNSLFYIWGPPGTGKTFTLTSIVFSLFAAEKRTLICSNTNQAVDQVLLKICQLGGNSALVEGGKVIRMGKIEHPGLAKKSEYVSLPDIVARLSSGLIAEKKQHEHQLSQLTSERASLEKIIRACEHLESLFRQKKINADHIAALQVKKLKLTKDASSCEQELKEAFHQRDSYEAAGTLKRVFMESPETTADRIRVQQSQKTELARALDRLGQELAQAEATIATIAESEKSARIETTGHQKEKVASRLQAIEKASTPLSSRLGEINRRLGEMEETVLKEARVIGATITKLFLNPKAFAGFDTVIIDEASMVIAPALYHAAGLAKERVIVSGDFRQLSPIVQTRQKVLHELLGRDVFTMAGISSSIAVEKPVPRLQMLRTQHRMDSIICDVIARPMYGGKLVTATERNGPSKLPPDPLAAPLTIIDTSDLTPFIGADQSGSKFNIIHALIARNLAIHLHEHGYGDFGICASYKAQTKLIREMLKSSHLTELGNVLVGTVHRFQGDEKKLIILDVSESYGLRMIGPFMQGETPDDNGPRLYNVAVSRAEHHLVIILNSRFIDGTLPGNAIVRGMLHQAGKTARWVNARDILALHPSDWDLNSEAGIRMEEIGEQGLFRQNEFASAVSEDLMKARKSVVIFSGFITASRAASYGEIFRKLIQRGVKVRCVVRPSEANGSIPKESAEQAIFALRAIGCVVDLRSTIHEKAVVIDEEIVWIGSLNPLSHTAETSELMLRFKGQEAAAQIAEFLSVEKRRDNRDFADAENPSCPNCGSFSILRSGRRGAYWTCLKESCDWKANPNERAKKATSVPESLLKTGIGCPDCKVPMRIRASAYGPFYGCPNYPRCRKTSPAVSKKR